MSQTPSLAQAQDDLSTKLQQYGGGLLARGVRVKVKAGNVEVYSDSSAYDDVKDAVEEYVDQSENLTIANTTTPRPGALASGRSGLIVVRVA